MTEYSIGSLAEMAGVSVRTLRYYDQIELLPPSGRTASGYRRYDRSDLFRLQQILYFREMDLPLKEIQALLDDPEFQPVTALRSHRRQLAAERNRLDRLMDTLDRTIASMEENDMPLTDEQLFAGFTKEEAESYRKEAKERWGESVAEVEQRLRKLSPHQWEDIKVEGGQVAADMAKLINREPGEAEVQSVVARHHRWIEHFYPAPAEVYLGLSELYVQHDGFRSYYDEVEEGLADFLSKAMKHYANSELA
jgi:DNA-binding transcriptional MerR regulator